MASANTNDDPLSERVAVALLTTAVVAYLVYLIFDVVNGWGLGFVILIWGLIFVGILAGLAVVISAWRWVYKGTGAYQVKQKQESR